MAQEQVLRLKIDPISAMVAATLQANESVYSNSLIGNISCSCVTRSKNYPEMHQMPLWYSPFIVCADLSDSHKEIYHLFPDLDRPPTYTDK